MVLRRGFKDFGDIEARPNEELLEIIGGAACFRRVVIGEGEPVDGGESPAQYRVWALDQHGSGGGGSAGAVRPPPPRHGGRG